MYKCERCQKTIEVDQEYEEIATHLFHTSCYIEGLVGAIITAPFQSYHIEETINKDGTISREIVND